jgi:hypothetical protein
MRNKFVMIKRVVFFSLTLLLIFPTIAGNPAKFEIVCSDSYLKQNLKKLCPEKKCRWKKLQSSKNASSWEKRGQFKVVENPLVKGIKVEILNIKISGLKLPWCFDNNVLSLPNRNILEEVASRKETLYLLADSDTLHLPRLKAIKHPCRKLSKLDSNIKGFSFYFLKIGALKGCL